MLPVYLNKNMNVSGCLVTSDRTISSGLSKQKQYRATVQLIESLGIDAMSDLSGLGNPSVPGLWHIFSYKVTGL